MSNEKREQQIVEAGKTAAEGKEFSVLVNKQRRTMSAYEIGFIEGAEWADSHPAWVSVEDELPTEVGRYWCCDDDNQQGELNWDGNSWRGEIDTYAVEGITHWMPMPQLPVKKGGQDAS